MAFSPSNISNNFLKRAFADGVDVSPMKLQKLLYFAASEYAKTTGKPLLDESFRAWRYGPVVRSVYDEFRSFGGSPIKAYAKDAAGKAYSIDERQVPELKESIDRIWQHAARFSAVELSRITHAPNSAWSEAYNKSEYIGNDALAADETYLSRLHLPPRRAT